MKEEYQGRLQEKIYKQPLLQWLTRCLYEFGHRGTSRNLLLASMWLDAAILTVIVLSAGDIEINPGPTWMTSI